jgi:hypothetical protein
MKSSYVLDAQLSFGSPGTITSAYESGAFDLNLGNAALSTDLLQPVLAQNQASKVFNAVIPVTAMKVSAGNELYQVKVQSSPDGVNWQDASRTATIGNGAITLYATAAGNNLLTCYNTAGLTTGQLVQYTGSGVTGLTSGNFYFLYVASSTTLGFATTAANAASDTLIAISGTPTSGMLLCAGGVTLAATAASGNLLTVGSTAALTTGQLVQYSGTGITGLTSGDFYFLNVASSTTIGFATTAANAVADTLISISGTPSAGLLILIANTISLAATVASGNLLTVTSTAGLTTGQIVGYEGSGVTGLTAGDSYYLYVASSTTVGLATSAANAAAATLISISGTPSSASLNALTAPPLGVAQGDRRCRSQHRR